MSNNKNNVTTGKPKVTGAIYSATIGTALPTDATTALPTSFHGLGYVSEDGLSETTENDGTIKAWGGDTVLSMRKKTFKYTLIEAKNETVLKHVYGDENVADADGAITILHVADFAPESHVIVIEMLLSGNRKKRTVIPNGVVTDVGEVKYTDTNVVGFETTLSAVPDENGMTAYEYISASVAVG
jgi:hypothetical protein